MVRDTMMNLPVRVAATLAASSDEREIIHVLTDAISQELSRLADTAGEDGKPE